MFKYIHVFGPILALWVIGILVEIACYKFLTAGKEILKLFGGEPSGPPAPAGSGTPWPVPERWLFLRK